MVSLPDVNVLVALTWPNHVHHESARAWFEGRKRGAWATCPVTESGFVRVSSNRRVIETARSPEEAIGVLRELTGLAGHTFWSDDTSLARSRWVAADRLLGYGQITDAHLLALTLARGGRLVTLDRGIVEILPPGATRESLIVLTP